LPGIVVYGATGFTGRLVVPALLAAGIEVVVAGRNADRLRRVAASAGVPFRVARLENPAELDAAFGDADVVLNVAGPFVETARPVIEACLRSRVHYLDVSGELISFLMAQRYDAQAKERGIMLMPGAGFVIVPSDCLAAHLTRRMRDATSLRLGLSHVDLVSRGTMRAMFSMVRRDVTIRRHGALTSVPAGHLEREIDYGGGPRMSVAISWADVATAYQTTGIPNTEAYAEVGSLVRDAYQLGAWSAELLRVPPWRWAVDLLADGWPEGPSAEQRLDGRRSITVEVENGGRWSCVSRLELPDGYTVTPPIAAGVVSRVLSGQVVRGFTTPGGLFGPDFILEIEGVERIDEPERPAPAPLRRRAGSRPRPDVG
jgi:short subunit dehydrogenase-like uncharacterized protein